MLATCQQSFCVKLNSTLCDQRSYSPSGPRRGPQAVHSVLLAFRVFRIQRQQEDSSTGATLNFLLSKGVQGASIDDHQPVAGADSKNYIDHFGIKKPLQWNQLLQLSDAASTMGPSVI